MPWGVAAAVVGSAVAADSSRSAANKQEDAANKASAQQQQMFSQTQQNVAPWLTAGQGALSQLVAGTQPGGALTQKEYTPFTQQQFQQDPGYQFQLQQGLNTLTNKASLGGGLNSNNLKGLLGFSQGLANQDYQQALGNYIQQYGIGNQARQQNFNNLEVLSQGGLGAGLQQGQISAGVGNQIGSNIIGAGNAQAAGQVGQTNAITGGLSNAYNQYLQSQFLGQGQAPSGGFGLGSAGQGLGDYNVPGYGGGGV